MSVPSPVPAPPFLGLQPSACPGCGAVLAPVPDGRAHPGASPSCSRLFEVTLRGLREDAAADAPAASAIRLADAASDPACRPAAWQMTVADVAADLDVVDLPALIEAWARTALADWR